MEGAVEAGLTEDVKLRFREGMTDLAIGTAASGGAAGLARLGARGAASALGAAGSLAGAARGYLSAFDDGARAAFETAGVDTADPEAVRRFVRDNPDAARAVSANAVTTAVTGAVSDKLGGWLAKKIADKVGGNWMVEEMAAGIGGNLGRAMKGAFKEE